jgi:hypothetical protein
LREFHARLSQVLQSLPMAVEIVYVNDGSHDDSSGILRRCARAMATLRCWSYRATSAKRQR